MRRLQWTNFVGGVEDGKSKDGPIERANQHISNLHFLSVLSKSISNWIILRKCCEHFSLKVSSLHRIAEIVMSNEDAVVVTQRRLSGVADKPWVFAKSNCTEMTLSGHAAEQVAVKGFGEPYHPCIDSYRIDRSNLVSFVSEEKQRDVGISFAIGNNMFCPVFSG
jgi:hypothetical protein